MYCPNCGAQPPAAKKFCRACGMDLQVTADELEAFQSGKAGRADFLRIERSALHRVYLSVVGGIFLIFASMASLNLGAKYSSGQVGQMISVLLAMAGALLAVRPVISLLRSKSRSVTTLAQTQTLPPSSPAGQLPPPCDDVTAVGVTETTTRTLQTYEKER